MGFEAAPSNSFRASALKGQRAPLLVTDKQRQADPTAEGLGAIKVARSEIRSANQRGADRHRLSDEQAVVRHKGKRHVVDLINLSHGGALVSGKFKAKLWDRVDLALGEDGTLECAVRWIKDGRLGLEFAHETQIDCPPEVRADLLRDVIARSFPDVVLDMPAPAEPNPAADRKAEPEPRRGAARHPLIWSGVVHFDFESTTVRLRNISARGALIECSRTLPAGAEPMLDLGEAGSIFARVSWTRGNQAGLVFDAPFDLSRLARARPQLAPNYTAPGHLSGDGEAGSPWAEEWDRLSLAELQQQLDGFLGR